MALLFEITVDKQSITLERTPQGYVISVDGAIMSVSGRDADHLKLILLQVKSIVTRKYLT